MLHESLAAHAPHNSSIFFMSRINNSTIYNSDSTPMAAAFC